MKQNRKAETPALLREEIGQALRQVRRVRGLTLREVSTKAQVSLGYLSEVERGQKEASSELLYAICNSLGIPMSFLLREVALRFARAEGLMEATSVYRPVNLSLSS